MPGLPRRTAKAIYQQLSANCSTTPCFVVHPADQPLAIPNSHLRIELPEVADGRDWYVSYIPRWNTGRPGFENLTNLAPDISRHADSRPSVGTGHGRTKARGRTSHRHRD